MAESSLHRMDEADAFFWHGVSPGKRKDMRVRQFVFFSCPTSIVRFSKE